MPFMDQIKNVTHLNEVIAGGIKKNPMPVVLYGADTDALLILNYLQERGIKTDMFCDDNAAKQGKPYCGLPVESYPEIKKKYFNGCYFIVAAPISMKKIYAKLIAAGENKSAHMIGFTNLYGAPLDYKYISDNAEKFCRAYDLMADEKSKKVFTNTLNYRLSGDMSYTAEIRDDKAYFDAGIIKCGEDEVFVDAGAFNGDTIKNFIDHTDGKYREILAFEPSRQNYEALRNMVSGLNIKNIELYNCGVWDKKDTLSFREGLTSSSRVSEAEMPVGDCVTIQVDAIDNALNGRSASFIKMDVEGSEMNAIKGCEKTIRKYRPKMAVSAYHKREDLFDITLLLKEYVPDYKFYLRHYSDTLYETVLYAVI